jgi:hypothetical protein
VALRAVSLDLKEKILDHQTALEKKKEAVLSFLVPSGTNS